MALSKPIIVWNVLKLANLIILADRRSVHRSTDDLIKINACLPRTFSKFYSYIVLYRVLKRFSYRNSIEIYIVAPLSIVEMGLLLMVTYQATHFQYELTSHFTGFLYYERASCMEICSIVGKVLNVYNC